MSFNMGCDPELMCHRRGFYVPASNYFRQNSSFGLDGCESIAECRPGISSSPIDLTAKLRTVIEYGHQKAPDIEFYAGHYVDNHPIGGHIHFGVPADPETTNSLDIVMYSLSNCIDDKAQRQRREKSGYGKRKAVRNKEYGFEYRTPGSWLLSPAVTLVNLTFAKLAVIAARDYKLDLEDIKGRKHSDTFLKNLSEYIPAIPNDCKEGLNLFPLLLESKIDWNQNILPNWGLN